MRFNLVTPLSSRDGTVNKDERLVNAYAEDDEIEKKVYVFKRAGIDEGDAVLTGNDIYGQGIFNYDGYLFAIFGDVMGYWIYVGGSSVGGGGGGWISFGDVPLWDELDTYDIGDEVWHEGSKYYSYSDNNIGNEPPSALWGATAPGTHTYQGTISWGGTGEVCSNTAAAGASAYLACPYNSCANRRLDTHQWLTFDSISGLNIRCHAYGVYSPDYCSGPTNDFGVSNYGLITQLS
jgi:hypothetical protein